MRKVAMFAAVMGLGMAFATEARADDPPAPVIVDKPMSAETSGTEGRGYQPSDLPAPDTRAWVNRPLLVTSAIVLVGAYVPMAAVAYTSERPSDQTNLYYPIVGPWMNLADRQCDVRACENEGLNKAMLVVDGVAQGIGALGVVASVFLPGKATRHWFLIGDSTLRVAPSKVGVGGYGLGAVGTF